jgi:hypothetical protein
LWLSSELPSQIKSYVRQRIARGCPMRRNLMTISIYEKRRVRFQKKEGEVRKDENRNQK